MGLRFPPGTEKVAQRRLWEEPFSNYVVFIDNPKEIKYFQISKKNPIKLNFSLAVIPTTFAHFTSCSMTSMFAKRPKGLRIFHCYKYHKKCTLWIDL